MIKFYNLSLKYGDSWILKNINLEINQGERVVITGPSGSGKSSLLNCLTGVHRPTGGEVLFRDEKISSQNIDSVRRQLSYIGQEPFLGAEEVEEALLLPFGFKSHRHLMPENSRIKETLNALNLPESILQKTASVISGGEKQRIAIARSLLLKKEVFILDEITSALDQESIDAVLELFSDSRYTLLSVSHEPNWIHFCTRQLTMNQGSLSTLSSPDNKEEPNGSH